MTSDELTALVEQRDVTRLVAELEKLTDQERRALAKTAGQLRKRAHQELDFAIKSRFHFSPPDNRTREALVITAGVKSSSPDNRIGEASVLARCADLAVLATASWTEARRVSLPHFTAWSDSCDNSSLIYRLLKDRPSDLIARWVDKSWPAILPIGG